jgi:hypothetical protein
MWAADAAQKVTSSLNSSPASKSASLAGVSGLLLSQPTEKFRDSSVALCGRGSYALET